MGSISMTVSRRLHHVISIGFSPPSVPPPLVGGGSLTRGGETWGAEVFLKVFIDLGAGGAHPQFPPCGLRFSNKGGGTYGYDMMDKTALDQKRRFSHAPSPTHDAL
mgnify:CR=1 FL=1